MASKNQDGASMPLPDVVEAKLIKDKQKNWVLCILTSTKKTLRVKPAQKDMKDYFTASKGHTREENAVILKNMAEHYLPKAMLIDDDTSEEESIDMPNRSAEDRALDMFAAQMIEKIKTIQSDWSKPWFTEGALGWPKNLNNRYYNGMNAVLLMLNAEKKGYKLPVWLTFDRVASLNYSKNKQGQYVQLKDENGEALPKVSVRKGEKSLPVFITTFSVVNIETKEKIKYDDYRNMSEDERRNYKVFPRLQVYSVFNVSQTNMEEARPELYRKLLAENRVARPETSQDEMLSFPAVDEIIDKDRWICKIQPTYGDEAYYSMSRNLIVVPEKMQFVDGESFYSNLFHEMAHSTGAESRLNRLTPAKFGTKEYAREELVAELSAALVAQKYGLTKHVKEDSAVYLKSWLNSLNEEPSFIKTVLLDVKKASHMIDQRIEQMKMELEAGKEKSENQPATVTAIVKTESVQKEEETVAKSLPSARTAYQNLTEIGKYDIPDWSLCYLQNGDADGLDDEEIELIDKFIKEKMQGRSFIMEVDWDNAIEFNISPAFGTRNPSASPQFGESPYQAVKTYEVTFYDATRRTRDLEKAESLKSAPVESPKEEVKEVKEERRFHIGR